MKEDYKLECSSGVHVGSERTCGCFLECHVGYEEIQHEHPAS